jgi:hypothetical protein
VFHVKVEVVSEMYKGEKKKTWALKRAIRWQGITTFLVTPTLNIHSAAASHIESPKSLVH